MAGTRLRRVEGMECGQVNAIMFKEETLISKKATIDEKIPPAINPDLREDREKIRQVLLTNSLYVNSDHRNWDSILPCIRISP